MRSIPVAFLLVCALLLGAARTVAAQGTVSGTVRDAETGSPIAGVNILVERTLEGTTTDGEGRYTVQVRSFPATLVFTFIGYTPERRPVSGSGVLDVAMTPGVELTDLVVVGSRFVPRTVITSPVPIDNIKALDLLATGQLTFDKMLTYTVPAFNASQQTISDATAHFDPADLRGLGPSRTLVLVNGKRKNPSALVYINDTPGKGEVGVDLKSIPASAVERVEVLRDGASAQYGSDAIAGVVNVILKQETDVTQVNTFSGITTEGDGFTYGYDINTGFNVGRDGFINVTHGFSDQNETNRAPAPGQDGLFGVAPDDPRFGAWLRDHPDLGMRVGMPNMTRGDVFFNGRVPLSDQIRAYSFGGFTYRKGISYALYRAPYWIPDPFNLYHDPGETYEGFQPTFETDIFDNTLALGVEGTLGGWAFDLSNTRGGNSVDYIIGNTLNTALGAESPTTVRAGGYEFGQNVTNLDFARLFDRFTATLGTEFRTENFIATAGEEASYAGNGVQSFPGLQPQNEVDAVRYNIGAYADLGADLTPALFLGGAARVESYSDFGENFSWKVNGRYQFWEERASLRAAASTGFRAPSLHQIYLSIIQTLVSGGTVSNQGTFNNLSPILRALRVPQLKDEKAFNLTAGLAVRPIPALFLSLDVYQVEVSDRIVYSSSIASADTTSVVGRILQQYSITSLKFFTNAVDTRTRGLDFVANYTADLDWGAVSLNLAANVNDTEILGRISTPAPIAEANVDIFDRKEQSRLLSARPADKVLLGILVERGPLRAALNNTRFGTVTWQHAEDPAKDQTFSAKVITDLNVLYQITGQIGLGVAVNNLLNVYPDPLDPKGDVLTDLGGRFRYPWEVNQFGFNGTMVTGNLQVRF